MKIPLRCLLFFCVGIPQLLFSQNLQEKLSVGFRFGPNLWINDMNDRRLGIGLEGTARYGVSKYFAPGIALDYEILKSGQFPLRPPELPTDYLNVTGFAFAAQGWLYAAPGNNFSPYFYSGLGVMFYSRKDGGGRAYPSVELGKSSSIYIPIGVGFEAFPVPNTAITCDFGYRILSQNTEYVPSGSQDGMLNLKIGVTLYFGSNEDDDDDNDGISNGRELELGLDPHNPDTDGDGLSDGDEIKIYKTDPLKADTDGDGLKDGDELWRFRTDPLKADTDKDGLSDGDEVSIYNTDPLKLDTDGDGLSDGEEVLIYHTDPLKKDTDGDGLTDSNEIFGYKTDPRVADTDGGGVNDGDEVKHGTNPLDPSDDFPKPVASVNDMFVTGISAVAEGVTFKPNSADLEQDSEKTLTAVLEFLTKNPDVELQIQGFTDNTGPREKNKKISYNRALSVKQWLTSRGVEEYRLSAKGFGSDKPIAPNTTEENMQKNRRIEFLRLK